MACQSNVRQQLLAVQLYANEHEDRLPVAKNFDWEKFTYPHLTFADFIQDALIPYLGGQRQSEVPSDPAKLLEAPFAQVFRCPSVERNPKFDWLNDPEQNHYRYNTHRAMVHSSKVGRAVSSVRSPFAAVIFYDIAFPDWDLDQFPHEGGAPGLNVGYVDGHSVYVTAKVYLCDSPAADYANEANNVFIADGWDGLVQTEVTGE